MASRARVVGAAAMAVAATLAGCAAIPSSGPVQLGRIVGSGAGGPSVPGLVASLPVPGMTPRAIVLGFLAAQAVPGSPAVARAYLTPWAARHWNAAGPITVFDDNRQRLRVPARGQVQLATRRIARISEVGRWSPRSGPLTLGFHLTRISGQWRLTRPPFTGRMLARTDLAGLYGEYRLAFLSADGRRVVSLPVVLPRPQPGLATQLVRSLLAGPPKRLAPAVTTALPAGTQLIPNVTVAAGTAEVSLSANVRQLSPARLRLAGDQLLITLDQLPRVHRLRLLVDRTVLLTLSRQALTRRPVRPDLAAPAALLLVRPGGRVVQRRSASSTLLRPGPQPRFQPLLGRHWPRLESAAVVPDGRIVAAAADRGGGSRLVAGSPGSRPMTLRRAGALRVLPGGAGRAVVVVDHRRLVSVDHGVRRLRVSRRWRLGRVDGAAFSPDGVTVAVVTGGGGGRRLVVGALAPRGALVGLHRVADLRRPEGLGWVDADTLATTVVHRGRRVMLTVDANGFGLRRARLPAGTRRVEALCVGPKAPAVVVAGGHAWQAQSGRWEPLGPARACSYVP